MYQMSRIPFDKLTASGGGCGICISNLRYSTTQSAISPANVTIGGKAATAEQLKDVATTANANSLANNFDVQKVQDQMALASTVGDVGALATNVVSTAMQRSEYVKRDEALKAAEDNLKATDPVAWQTYQAHPSAQALVDIEFNQALQTNPVLKAEYEALPKDKQDTFVQDQINQGKGFGVVSNAEAAWHQTQNQYGPGSDFSRTAQALSGLAAGLASGNTGQALSNLTQPYLASAIGTYFDNLERQPDGTMNHEYAPERLLAHAAAGAAIAYLSGNNATAGATGAVSGEAMAIIVHDQLYGNKPTDQLTTAEKESIRAVATLASGLAGALQGGSFETAATSAAAGYNAAVNNETGRTKYNSLSKSQAYDEMNKTLANGDLEEYKKLYAAYSVYMGGILSSDSYAFGDKYSCVKAKGAGFCSANNWKGVQTFLDERALDMAMGMMGGGMSLTIEKASASVLAKLTAQEVKSVKSYERLIEEHLNKIQEFKNNPTIRKGMENLSPSVIAQQQAARIRHLENEIRAFQKNITDIIQGK